MTAHVHSCVCVCVYACLHAYECVCVCGSICMSAHVFVCICMYVFLHKYVCACECMSALMCECECVCMSMYMSVPKYHGICAKHTTYRSQLPSSIPWGVEMKSRSSGLVAGPSPAKPSFWYIFVFNKLGTKYFGFWFFSPIFINLFQKHYI